MAALRPALRYTITIEQKMIGNLVQIVLLIVSFMFPAASAVPAARQDQSRPIVLEFVKNPDLAPSFTIKDLNGNALSLSDARGKVVLLNFWATWCGPCRAEIPDLIELQKEYKDQLEIIGLATEEDDADEVKKFVATSGINYRVAMAPDKLTEKFGGIAALPTSFVIDPQGRVVQKHVGLNDPSLYELEVRSLLGQPVNAKVEYFEDTGQVFLANAVRATELPGVDLSKLTPAQKKAALRRFNSERCTCGCDMTLAQCRINDSGCDVSRQLAQKIVMEIRSGKTEETPSPVKTGAGGSKI
jgi:thiol-disulfide isomerase/thioredoxin